jgi:hypothetical protein
VNKKIKLLASVIAAGMICTACGSKNGITSTQDTSSDSAQVTQAESDKETKSTEPVTISQQEEESSEQSKQTPAGTMASKAKEYILNGQNDKPEAGKWNWSESFLNQVNMDEVYQQYLSAGGKADDVESFVKYLSENAPVPKNWKSLFETDLLNSYGEKASKYVLLENELYQVYVKKDGSEIPYVVVNARTGYYHG